LSNPTIDPNVEVKRQSARRTRRDFLVAAIAAAGGYEFYHWLENSPQEELLQGPLRKTMDFNEKVSRDVLRDRGLAPTYPISQAKQLRVNGDYGIKKAIVPDSFRVQVVGVDQAQKYPQYTKDVTSWEYKYEATAAKFEGHSTKEAPKAGASATAAPAAAPAAAPNINAAFAAAMAKYTAAHKDVEPRGNEEAGQSDSSIEAGTPGLLLTVADATKFPMHELVTQFKCIEGWSEIVQWKGVRLSDFIAAYPPAKNAQGKLPEYVYMETPNGDYYCGFHLEECMHPQSLLVTEMSGQPLTQFHGAPLRLHMPIKYGYKQIKRIGLIAYTDQKPDDYWTKLGYDWYAGL
jgi:Oxidoreductase molybdopterin binding domain